MSYDLMVFRKQAAPKTGNEFMKWYHNQVKWTEKHSYDDPANTSVALSNWFKEMIQTFPAMNGPYAEENNEEENDFITDYSIGSDIIYVGFRWSVAEQAYDTMLELANKHHVAFFDVSSVDGDILFPEHGIVTPIEQLNQDLTQSNTNENIKKNWWKFW